MSTNLGFAGRLLASAGGKVLSFGGTVTPPVVLPTPAAPLITAENDTAQTLTFSVPGGLGVDQVRYEVAGAGPYTPTGFEIQLSPTVSYMPGAVALYVAAIADVRNESNRVYNQTTLAAAAVPNTTPTAPSLAGNDSADTLTVSSTYALAELEQRITDSGAVVSLPALVQQVGDVDRPEGYYQVRVRASTGRNVSAWARSLPFTKVPVAPPTGGGGNETWTKVQATWLDINGWTVTGNGGGDTSSELYQDGNGIYMTNGALVRRTESFRHIGFFIPRLDGGYGSLTCSVWLNGVQQQSQSFSNVNPTREKSGHPDGNTAQILFDLGAVATYEIRIQSTGVTVFDFLQYR